MPKGAIPSRCRANGPKSDRRYAPRLWKGTLHAKLTRLAYTNRVECAAVFREVATRLGEVAYAGELPAPGANAFGTSFGAVARHGLMIEVPSASFNAAATGLPAFADWLCGLGCRHIQYDLEGGAKGTDFEDSQ